MPLQGRASFLYKNLAWLLQFQSLADLGYSLGNGLTGRSPFHPMRQTFPDLNQGHMKVVSREHKLLVQHEAFAEPSRAVEAVWGEIEEAAETLTSIRTKGKRNDPEPCEAPLRLPPNSCTTGLTERIP